MNRLGSEFLKELDSYERPVIGLVTFRQLILLVGIGLVSVLATILVYFQAPDIIVYSVIGGILPPFVIFGLKFDEIIRDHVRFAFTKQERAYQIEFEREEFSKDAFLPEKGVTEYSDSF